MQAFDTFRIGNDPELRYTAGQNPTAVINLSLACNYGRKDPQTGKRPTQWVDATLWGAQAEALAPYLVKGGEITVTLDDLHMEEFQRGGGGTGVKLAGRISNLKLVGGAPQQQQGSQQQPRQQHSQHPQADAARQPAPRNQTSQQSRPQQQAPQPQQNFDDFDDDIPF